VRVRLLPPSRAGRGGLHTREAVRDAHVLAVVLAEEHADDSSLGALCLAAVVICSREEHERRDRDIARNERQRLCCGGRHRGGVYSVRSGREVEARERLWGVVVVLRGSCGGRALLAAGDGVLWLLVRLCGRASKLAEQ
jgi:hypothetical protein